MSSYAIVAAWAIDFIRAMQEQSWISRVLLRLSMGKYAYREFIGMIDGLEQTGCSPYLGIGYSLEGMDYHQDKLPFIDWWSEREPIKAKDI